MTTPKKPIRRDVTRSLAGHKYEKPELTALVSDLYKLSPENRDFLHARFGLGADPIAPYKLCIEEALFPDVMSNDPVDINRAKQALRRYEKAIGDPAGVLDLMLFFVERGHTFINEYGYDDESFFAALERMFSRALILLKTQDASTQDGLRPRCQRIVDEVCGIGWGHHDELLRCWTEASPKS